MNPILVFLIFLAGFLLWLMLAFLYTKVGKLFGKLWGDAIDTMKEEDETKKEEKENVKQ